VKTIVLGEVNQIPDVQCWPPMPSTVGVLLAARLAWRPGPITTICVPAARAITRRADGHWELIEEIIELKQAV
jgi:hypothetical protein